MTGRRLYIVEGPDGSGKTTLATALTRAVQGTLVHHGSYLGVAPALLSRIYSNSMMPAVDDVADVVLDRSWLSEPIYGAVMRGGVNRIMRHEVVRLERLAALADAVIILCLPPVEACLQAFSSRPREEYLKKEQQLRDVWDGYAGLQTSLPLVVHNRLYVRGPEALGVFVDDIIRGRKS